jgi:hypothetical protein
LLGAGLIIPGIIIGTNMLADLQGWFHFVIVAMIIVPVVTMLHYLEYPVQQNQAASNIQHPKDVLVESIRDPTKGVKLFLFTSITTMHLALLIGLNGLRMDLYFFSTTNWLFYFSISGGAAACVALGWFLSRRVHGLGITGDAAREARITWFWALIVQCIGWLATASCEVMVTGYHGTLVAQLVDGIVLSVMITTYFVVIFQQHPPRCVKAYVMLVTFFIAFGIAAGSYLKVVPTSQSEFRALVKYLPVIFEIEFVAIIILILLLFIPAWLKKKSYDMKITRIGEKK